MLLLPGRLVGQVAPAGSIAGSVTMTDPTGAVEAADVALVGTSLRTRTDASGRYLIPAVPVGDQVLIFRSIGFIPDTVRVAVSAGERTRVDARLRRGAQLLQQVVVTAQKRAQALVDVPIAITAYDQEFLQANQVQAFDALSSLVPGLVVELQSPNNPSFSIRGITSEGQNSQQEPRVSVFQDGVSISKATGSVVELFDLERVEVLRGPQGTLFGRAAEIGAVHLIQNKAANQKAAGLEAGYGSYSNVRVQGFANAPLVTDRLFGRVAGLLDGHDGFVENLAGGALNGKATVAVRGALRWLPGDRTVVDLIGNFQSDQPPGVSFKSGVHAPVGGNLDPRTPADLEEGTALGLDRTVWGVTLLLSNLPGPEWQFNAITAFRRFDSDELFDADGTVAPALSLRDIGAGSQFSQELRATFDDGHRFAGFGGAGFFWEDGSQSTPLSFNEQSYWPAFTGLLNQLTGGAFPITPVVIDGQPNFVPSMPPEVVLLNPALAPLVGQPFATSHSESQTNYGRTWSVDAFADGTLRVVERLRLTAGLRATHSNVSNGLEVTNSATTGLVGYIINTVPNDLYAPSAGRNTGVGKFTTLVGRVITNYLVTDRLNIYAGVARGVRPAVVNVLADTVQTLPNEIVWSYEGGVKAVAVRERVQLNASGFYYDYTNFQVDQPYIQPDRPAILLAQNAGPMTAWGVEASVQVAATRGLSLFANYAYLNAAFDSTNPGGTDPLYPGNRPRQAPGNTFSVGASFTFPVGGSGSAFVQPAYAWRSQMFFTETNDPLLQQGAYGLLGARIGWISRSQRWNMTLWGRNLLDANYVVDAGNTGAVFNLPTFVAGGRRQVGVQVGWTR
jgi:outer membrane receptor protein involved in Fe transport